MAALLNAASPSVSYPYGEAALLALVQDAWSTGDFEIAKNMLERANEAYCPLN